MLVPIRVFVAARLPESVLAAIGGLQERLAARGFGVRWVVVGNIHLTVKFLGEIDDGQLDGITRVLNRTVCSFAPFRLTAAGVGVFPRLNRARVIWVGLKGQLAELRALRNAIEGDLEAVGHRRDKRPFTGHLTLGRVKKTIAPSELRTAIDAVGDFASEPFMVDRVVLFRSDLRPSGAAYTELRQFLLSRM
jgi:2'-5' RNA ligase